MTPPESQDTNDITGVIAVEQINNEVRKHMSEWPKYIVIVLTIISIAVGAAIWATSAHAAIRSWTAEQDFVTKSELRDVMKEQYVPLHEFTKVQQCLDDYRSNLEKMDKKLDKVLDQLHNRNSRR